MEFQGFDSWEEVIAAIREASETADKRVQDWQAAIKPGDYFIKDTPYGFLIFGKVLDCDDEFYKTQEGKNYRFCECFSVACPFGEMGDVHVSAISCIIKKETFEHFKANNWQIDTV